MISKAKLMAFLVDSSSQNSVKRVSRVIAYFLILSLKKNFQKKYHQFSTMFHEGTQGSMDRIGYFLNFDPKNGSFLYDIL